MSQLVSELLSIGGRSLEEEERWLRSDARRRGGHGGLLTIDRICFCQYVFGRAILPKYKSTFEFTLDGRRVGELGVKFERKHYFFILDHWKDEPLAPLQDDVDRLAKQKAEAYLMVFAANPHGETEDRLRLVDALAGIGPRAGVHRFGAQTENGENYEFWVGGWRVPKGRTPGP
jgi:hypothetical protein